MITNELLFHTLEINNDLILSIKKAKGRYQQELEEKRSCKVKNDKEKQSTLLQEETNVIKKIVIFGKAAVCFMRSLLIQ